MEKSWMVFIDGENLTFRAEAIVKDDRSFELQEGQYYEPGSFVWMPKFSPIQRGLGPFRSDNLAERAD